MRKSRGVASSDGEVARQGRQSRGIGSTLLSSVAIGALATPILAPAAFAGTYTASDEAAFRNAIAAANADPDPNDTITRTNNVSIASTTAFPALTKPMTINTAGFTLQGANVASGTATGTSLTFRGGTFNTLGSIRGDDAAPSGTTATGGTAMIMYSGGSLTNKWRDHRRLAGPQRRHRWNGGAGVSLTTTLQIRRWP
jgi:hypothetical protein